MADYRVTTVQFQNSSNRETYETDDNHVTRDISITPRNILETKPRIVDLCDDDRKRILDLVDELSKTIEERKDAEKKTREITEVFEEKLEKMRSDNKKESKCLKREILKLKELTSNLENALSKSRETIKAQDETIKRMMLLNRTLDEEKSRIELRVAQLGLKLKDISMSTVELKSCLRGVQETMARRKVTKIEQSQQTEDFVDQSQTKEVEVEQTVEEVEVEEEIDCECEAGGTENCNRKQPASDDLDSRENAILNELFFKTDGLPLEMEEMFFLPAHFTGRPPREDLLEDLLGRPFQSDN